MKRTLLFSLIFIINFSYLTGQNTNESKFKQLYDQLATPNIYRTAAGAPGHKYYQNNAHYSMDITLNDQEQKITGKETITYVNNSPDALEYLWIQLDQNVRSKSSDSYKIATGDINGISSKSIKRIFPEFDGGFNISSVTDKNDKKINYIINKTMMRINLDKPLLSGSQFELKIEWWYNINERAKIGGRSGFEYFKKDDNYLYTIAQFFPRMCVYNDVEGWQNKQFLGSGEFTLPFGNYEVNITVPANHIVSATGELINEKEILSQKQLQRLEEAKNSFEKPVFIVNEKEAIKNEKSKLKSMKTWKFKAKNVRDFGWASSKKFIWDAMNVKQETKNVMAMSFYPKEGNPLWEQYSTKAVAHTLKTYSKYTFDYPYPVAISIHSKSIGMEYPMICFNGGRPDKDGTYSERTKYGMISVIIHEVGHNYFPMIVNSDERQWTWMDEGLNTFLQFLSEKEWDYNYPSRRGPAYKIVNYMKGNKSTISPIMTNSESIHQFGNNAYGKPATALNILRETIMGRELFDYAFKTYSKRWMFKHPTPDDFFRTMEDASAVDLDWFWRGWFFTNDHVDISLDKVIPYKINSQNPTVNKGKLRKEFDEINSNDISNQRNKEMVTYLKTDNKLADFYNSYDRFEVTEKEKKKYKDFLANLSESNKSLLNTDYYFYELSFSNLGGLVMPLILEFEFEDGTKSMKRIPAEIWKKNNDKIQKVFGFKKEVKSIYLDPFLETADTDLNNNSWPMIYHPSTFELFKEKSSWEKMKKSNPMKENKKK
ncbi:MAG: M1 family metallopeptidase [Flavobacteriales bacterium]|nr:M1 family metallopeptidase [Flavobacteriales bacterium]